LKIKLLSNIFSFTIIFDNFHKTFASTKVPIFTESNFVFQYSNYPKTSKPKSTDRLFLLQCLNNKYCIMKLSQKCLILCDKSTCFPITYLKSSFLYMLYVNIKKFQSIIVRNILNLNKINFHDKSYLFIRNWIILPLKNWFSIKVFEFQQTKKSIKKIQKVFEKLKLCVVKRMKENCNF